MLVYGSVMSFLSDCDFKIEQGIEIIRSKLLSDLRISLQSIHLRKRAQFLVTTLYIYLIYSFTFKNPSHLPFLYPNFSKLSKLPTQPPLIIFLTNTLNFRFLLKFTERSSTLICLIFPVPSFPFLNTNMGRLRLLLSSECATRCCLFINPLSFFFKLTLRFSFHTKPPFMRFRLFLPLKKRLVRRLPGVTPSDTSWLGSNNRDSMNTISLKRRSVSGFEICDGVCRSSSIRRFFRF